MTRLFVHVLPFLPAVFFSSCNLERDIEIDLPGYVSRPVVECYLEPGRPYTLLLTNSTAFFDALPALNEQFLNELLISDAEVTIAHRGRLIRLQNELTVDLDGSKFFNYRNSQSVPADFESPFELTIRLPGGRTIRASTRLLPPVPIDSAVVEFPVPARPADTLARVLTYLTDPPGVRNYYRRVLHRGRLGNGPEQDFTTDDRFVERVLVFGTGFDFAPGDTVIQTVYHIDRAYFDFLQTLRGAINANGNPFAQPSPVLSNFTGDADAIGIFTGLSYQRVTTIIGQ